MIIYKLISPSGKCYIGKTKYDFKIRLKQHIQHWKNKNRKYISKLYNAFDKYPPELWTHEIIEYVEDKDLANQKEIYYISKYDTTNNGYNIVKGGDGRLVDYLSEDHKNNLSEARKKWYNTEQGIEWKSGLREKFIKNNPCKVGNIPWNKGKTGIFCHKDITKERISKLLKGRKFTDSHRKNISIGKFGKKLDPEKCRINGLNRVGKYKQTINQKQKAREANQLTWKIEYPDGKIEIVTNLRQFCKIHNLSSGNMTNTLKYPNTKTKGFKVLEKIL